MAAFLAFHRGLPPAIACLYVLIVIGEVIIVLTLDAYFTDKTVLIYADRVELTPRGKQMEVYLFKDMLSWSEVRDKNNSLIVIIFSFKERIINISKGDLQKIKDLCEEKKRLRYDSSNDALKTVTMIPLLLFILFFPPYYISIKVAGPAGKSQRMCKAHDDKN